MAEDIKIELPPEVSKSKWDTAKSPWAKLLVGKTDIGATLAEVETAYKDSGFAAIKNYDYTKENNRDPENFKEKVTSKVAKVKEAADKLKEKVEKAEKAAEKAHGEFKSHVGLKGTQADYVKKIWDALKTFKAAVEGVPDKVKKAYNATYNTNLGLDNDAGKIRVLAQQIEQGRAALLKKIEDVERAGTVERLKAEFGKQGLHYQISSCCMTWDNAVKKYFPKTAAKHFSGTAVSDILSLAGVSDLAGEVDGRLSKLVQGLVQQGRKEDVCVVNAMRIYKQSWPKVNDFLTKFAAASKDLGTALTNSKNSL